MEEGESEKVNERGEKEKENARARCIAGKKGTRIKGH